MPFREFPSGMGKRLIDIDDAKRCGRRLEVTDRGPEVFGGDSSSSGCGGQCGPGLRVDETARDTKRGALPQLIGKIRAFLCDEEFDNRRSVEVGDQRR